MPWVFNDTAIDQAREILEFEKPVQILRRRMKWSLGRYLGIYYNWDWEPTIQDWIQGSDFHRITITSAVGATKASRLLWHELTHASQRELYGEEFGEIYDQQLRDIGLSPHAIEYGRLIDPKYREIPMEREAFGNEEKHSSLPLTKYVPERRNRRHVSAITIPPDELMKELQINA